MRHYVAARRFRKSVRTSRALPDPGRRGPLPCVFAKQVHAPCNFTGQNYKGQEFGSWGWTQSGPAWIWLASILDPLGMRVAMLCVGPYAAARLTVAFTRASSHTIVASWRTGFVPFSAGLGSDCGNSILLVLLSDSRGALLGGVRSLFLRLFPPIRSCAS